MGNIHFKTGQYNKAIKYYRMALDQVLPPLMIDDHDNDHDYDDDTDIDNDIDDDQWLWY